MISRFIIIIEYSLIRQSTYFLIFCLFKAIFLAYRHFHYILSFISIQR